MIEGLKPYPKYKDSGVPRLGQVPKGWIISRLKSVCQLRYGDSLPADGREAGPVPVFGSNGVVGYHSVSNTRAPTVIIGRKGSYGKLRYSSVPSFAIDTSFFVDDSSTRSHLRWLYYLLGTLDLDHSSKDSAVPGLDRADAYERVVAAPSDFGEQLLIARFLDHAELKIRRYTAAKRTLIKLLEEEKQAIIHRAVTRGLDPKSRIERTANEWFPELPSGWQVLQLRRVIRQAVDGPHHSPNYLDEGIPFLSARNIRANRWILENAKFISRVDYDEF